MQKNRLKYKRVRKKINKNRLKYKIMQRKLKNTV